MIHTRLNVCSREPQLLCSIDPATLGTLALTAAASTAGAAASGAFSGGGGGTPQPQALPQQQAPQQSPTGGKKTNAPPMPSFMGGAPTAPASGSGGKTLLGQ